MIILDDFLKYIAEYGTTYIVVTGEKIAVSLGHFMMRHPNNWGGYIVWRVKADNDDLIIEVRRPVLY